MKFRYHMSVACIMASSLLCLFPSFSSADTLSGKIKGTIKDEQGAMVAGACVLFERHLGELPPERQAGNYSLGHKMITTYQNGAVFEVNLPTGVYLLRVAAWGFNEFSSEPFRLAPGEIKTIDVALLTSGATALFGVTKRPLEDPLVTLRGKGIKRLVEFKTILLTRYSRIRKRGNVVITNAKGWEGLWNKIHSTGPPRLPNLPRPELPRIDFEKSMVIATFNGEVNTGG
ncbi:MAG: hypothetical protein ACREBG_26830 [Pyrinomonadaceae bacterium]